MRLNESAKRRLTSPLANTLQAALPWLAQDVCEVIAAAVVETVDDEAEAREEQQAESWPETHYQNGKTIWGEKSP